MSSKYPRCPYCGGPTKWLTEHAPRQLKFLVNGKIEPDGFMCIAQPRCLGLYPGTAGEAIHKQRLQIAQSIV